MEVRIVFVRSLEKHGQKIFAAEDSDDDFSRISLPKLSCNRSFSRTVQPHCTSQILNHMGTSGDQPNKFNCRENWGFESVKLIAPAP
jgi:hypothetical protein